MLQLEKKINSERISFILIFFVTVYSVIHHHGVSPAHGSLIEQGSLFSNEVQQKVNELSDWTVNHKNRTGLKKELKRLETLLKNRKKVYLNEGIEEQNAEAAKNEFKLLQSLGFIEFERLKSEKSCENVKLSLRYLEDPKQVGLECVDAVHLLVLKLIAPLCVLK